MRFLITGAAGFIGFHLTRRLLEDGHDVTGIDNLNDYYSVALKKARLAQLDGTRFVFERLDLADKASLERLFSGQRFDVVINLAAQAGVRYSLVHPDAYLASNLTGFGHLLECCRQHHIGHLIFASSSSVYGLNGKMPFSVHDGADHPASLYAATKKSNELMAHSYSHLFHLPVTGLRFFTVYGPWGRPDMALFSFTKAILEGRPIQVFNHGRMRRDFTYIDDIIDGIAAVIANPATPDPAFDRAHPDPAKSSAPYRLYNIGHHAPVTLDEFITTIEDVTGRRALRENLPMQPGDVEATFADVSELQKLGFQPRTSLREGIRHFYDWYLAWKDKLAL